MINKELLSIMLGKDITNISEPVVAENNIVYTCTDNSGWDIINIYELADKCKEWAYDNGCMLRTNYENTIDGKLYRVSIARVCKFNERGDGFYSTYEPEAIFKACEYIYAKLLKD